MPRRRQLFDRSLDEGRALICRRLAVPGKEFVASDRLFLPVPGDDGDAPSVLFGAMRFLAPEDLIGTPDEDGVYSVRFDIPAI